MLFCFGVFVRGPVGVVGCAADFFVGADSYVVGLFGAQALQGIFRSLIARNCFALGTCELFRG